MDLSTDTVHAKNDLRFSNAMNLSLMQDYGVQCTFSKKHLVLVHRHALETKIKTIE